MGLDSKLPPKRSLLFAASTCLAMLTAALGYAALGFQSPEGTAFRTFSERQPPVSMAQSAPAELADSPLRGAITPSSRSPREREDDRLSGDMPGPSKPVASETPAPLPSETPASTAGIETATPAEDGTPAGTAPTASPNLPSNRGGNREAVAEVEIDLAVDRDVAHWAFIGEAVGPAQQSERETGVPASVTIGQAIHESAWGGSRLSREGKNYFGIKATGKPGTKGVIRMDTKEVVKGATVTVSAAFRAYNTMAESFVDHGHFFQDNSRYARAMANTGDPRAFLRLIVEAGYATDPAYVRKVLAHMDRYNLFQYDLP